MKWLIIGTLLVLAQQLVTANDINLISSYDETLLKAQDTIPGLDAKVEAIFAKLEPYSNATEKVVKLTGSSASNEEYQDSAHISIWNGGSFNTAKIAKAATIALAAYKELMSTEKTVALGYSNKPAKIPAPFCPKEDYIYCNPSYPYRSFNGSCNNLQYPWWGMAESPYKRLLQQDYDDGVTVPRIRSFLPGKYLPNTRRIALIVHKPHKSISEWTNMLLWFGQSVAHDLSLIASATQPSGEPKSCHCNSKDSDCFNVPIPYEDYHNKDQACITFVRSSPSVKDFSCNLGPREQINLITHWADLSHIYGNNAKTSIKLRLYKGGLLKYSQIPNSSKQQLPRRPGSQCPTYKRLEKCFLAGDPRAEDNAFLTSMHTIWMREHNRIAYELSYLNPKWDDETIFQEARRIAIAEMQHLVYAEYLPAILGDKISRLYGLLPLQSGYFDKYDYSLYPQIANEFTAAAMRYCHSLVPLDLRKGDANYNLFHTRPTSYYLFNSSLAFYYPDAPIRGSLAEWAYYPSPQVNPDLNNYLFNFIFPDSKRFSLPVLNIQRGRDHGIPSYNFYRELCGLNFAYSFDELSNIPPYVIARLKSVYQHPNDIDLWTGLVSEYPVEGGTFGATAACIVAKQFRDLKFGDRFYYEGGHDKYTRFTLDQLSQLRKATVARLLCDNLEINFIQQFPLLVANREWNKLIDCSAVPRLDLTPWKDYY